MRRSRVRVIVNRVFNSTRLLTRLESVATMIETQPLGDEAAQASALAAGMDPGMAAGEWFAVLYHELRRMARGELFRHKAITLGANTLVHEAWIKLAPSEANFTTPAALISYVARVMRGIVIDHIRERSSLKRGGEFDFTQRS